ncbi:MAG: hypothetical protein WEB31_05005 [Chthoniobacterales bacterium]
MRARLPILLSILVTILPAGAADDHAFDAASLEGTHALSGRNPDGSVYQGEVTVQVKDGLVLLQRKIGESETLGTGVVVGRTLGVALPDGVAVYGAVPQAGGWSLVGLWSREGSGAASEETIFAGNADVTDARFEAAAFNGTYTARRKMADGSQDEERMVIAGEDVVKTLSVGSGERVQKAEGLALGEGLAAITPDGLMVLNLRGVGEGERELSGVMVLGDGSVPAVSLVPRD